MISLKRFTPRVLQVTMGLMVLCAFAVVPMTAQAETVGTTGLNGEVEAGALSVVAPLAIAMPPVHVTGSAQVATETVPSWQFADLTGQEAGYSVVVSAPDMYVGTSERYTITLKAQQAQAKDKTAEVEAEKHNAPASMAEAGLPVGEGSEAVTIQEAELAKGNGAWEVPAGPANIAVGVPPVTPSGQYTDTLTFTISAGV